MSTEQLKPKWDFLVTQTALRGSSHKALLPTSSPVPVHPPTSLLPLVPGDHAAVPVGRLARGTGPIHSLNPLGATGLRERGGHT